jgi:hypothetical protein
MTPRFARHFAEPPPVRVLGLALPRFTLWHQLQLELAESPFASYGVETFTELYIATRICACGKAEMEKAESGNVFSFPLSRFPIFLKWLIFGRRWQQEADDLFEHIQYHSAGPVPVPRTPGRALSTPQTLYLHTAMMDLGFPEERAWSLSPGEARCRLACRTEAQGIDPQIRTARNLADYRAAGYDVEGWDC